MHQLKGTKGTGSLGGTAQVEGGLNGQNQSGAPIRDMQRKVGERAHGEMEVRMNASIKWRKWNKRRWRGIRI
jgi:hypothetical protein